MCIILILVFLVAFVFTGCSEEPASVEKSTVSIEIGEIETLLEDLSSVRINRGTFTPAGDNIVLNRSNTVTGEEEIVIVKHDSSRSVTRILSDKSFIPLEARISFDSTLMALVAFPWQEIKLLSIPDSEIVNTGIKGDKLLFSPDGKFLFFRQLPEARLAAYDLSNRKTYFLSDNFHGRLIGYGFHPADTTIIAIFRYPEKISAIASVSPKSLKIRNLGFFPDRPLDIAFSPSGNVMVYTNTRGRIRGYSLKDSSTFPVQMPDSIYAVYLDWSRNGKELLFTGGFYQNLFAYYFRKQPLITRILFTAQIEATGIEDSVLLADSWPEFEIYSENFSLPEEKKVSLPEITLPLRVSPPVFVSVPKPVAHRGEEWVYYARANDADVFDEISYRLIEGPEGMKILPHSGILFWTPNDRAEHTKITIGALDIDGNEDRQSFMLYVY